MSGYVVDGVHRCVICSGRLLYRPETRDVCEGCRKLRGDLTELPIVHRPMAYEVCPECGVWLDPGVKMHPDCAATWVLRELKAKEQKGRDRL